MKSRSRRSWNRQHLCSLTRRNTLRHEHLVFIFSDISGITLFLSLTRSSHPNDGFAHTSLRSCPTSCLSSKESPAQPPSPRPNSIRLPPTPVAGASLLEKSKNSRTCSSPSPMIAVVIPSRPQKRTEPQSTLEMWIQRLQKVLLGVVQRD